MYYIKSLFLTGDNVEKSVVDFTPGMNLIYGPSQTGKSYIAKCIKFMFGKKDADIDTTLGFDTVHMIVDVDGKPLTLVRKLDGTTCEVSGNIDGINSGTYTLDTGKHRLGDLWLKLMGIESGEKIIKKGDYSTERLNYSSLWHMFLLDEHTIDKEESILMPSQYSKWPKTKAAILYLMTGRNYLENYDPEAKAKEKENHQAIEKFINERVIASLVRKKQALPKECEGKSVADLEKTISAILSDIESMQTQLDQSIEQSRKLSSEIVEIDEELANNRALQNRYKALRSQYRSDIRRLTFIAEGDIQRTSVKRADKCPFCGGKVDKTTKATMVEPAKAEVERLVPKISDLQDTQDEIAAVIKSLTEKRAIDAAKKTSIEQQINSEIQPKIATLRDRLVEYTQAVQVAKAREVLSEVENDINDEMKQQAPEEKESQKFDPDTQFTTEVISSWEKILDSLLRECHYDKYDLVSFSLKSFDAVINGRAKKTFGQGYCAFVNVLIVLMLQQYLEQNGAYHSDVLVFDSPILSLKERVTVKASEGMQASLFKYLVAHQSGHQTIVIENEPPKIDYTGVNMIEFTQEENGTRYGFLKGVK